MAAGDPLVDLSDLINLATGGSSGAPEQINIWKTNTIDGGASGANVAGTPNSMFQYDGSPSGFGATAPGAGGVCTNTTNGGLKQSSPASGKKKRLVSLVLANAVAGGVILCDRLAHMSGLSGTATGSQTTNLPTATLTRYTNGVGVQGFVEIYSAIGGTIRTFTVGYDGDSGTGHTSQARTIGSTGAQVAQQMISIPVASGDKGIKKINSLTLSGSTSTAGDFGVTLLYPVLYLPVVNPGVGAIWNSVLTPGGPIDLGTNSDACLTFVYVPNGSGVSTVLYGIANFLEK